MSLFSKLAFVCIILVIVSVLFIVKSFRPIPLTGEIVFLTNITILAIFISFSLIFLIFFFVKKEEKKVKIPVEELEKMMYVIDDIERGELSEKSKAKQLVKYLLPPLEIILTSYKDFVHSLPTDYRAIFYDVYSSLKHPHYHPGRLMRDSRHLQEAIKELTKRYKI